MGATDRILAGGNRFRAFSVTDSTAPSTNATAALDILDDIISTTIDRDEATSAFSVSVESVEDNPTVNTYLETYMSVSTSGAIEEILFEDSVKEPASTSANQTQLVISRGGLQGGTAGAARKVITAAVRLSNTSGGYTQAGETYNRITLQYDGFKLSGAYTVPATYYNSIMTTPAVVGLTASFPYGRISYA